MKFLKPIENFYHLIVKTKNQLYKLQILHSIKLEIPVISIGNLSFGGTGKTPCIIFLAEVFSENYKINIITKSYKANLKKAQEVKLQSVDAAARFGDEACLIKSKLLSYPNCNVWSGPSKSLTALASLSNHPDLILVDDGFSHLKLARNFDLVLIDASIGFDSYLRESLSSLRRAHAVLVTKTNLSTPQKIIEIENKLKIAAPHLKENIFFSSVKTELSIDKTLPLYVFCGLARPDTFLQDLQQQGFNILIKKIYPDHYHYPESEQHRIFSEFSEMQLKHKNLQIVTTEKDLTKITNIDLKRNVHIATHKFEMDQKQKGVLLEKIRKSF